MFHLVEIGQRCKSLVRPHLEYCTPCWSPHYGKGKALLEKNNIGSPAYSTAYLAWLMRTALIGSTYGHQMNADIE
jgi:hypothetical protein